ncbi:hypothetical protein J1C56_02185 [Aminobacter anthyllidis]|uniref:Uncharacterized protein n=1 Tax=Aminobacter anthyllidis TaxID=1035067 RepID=A0A9X1A6V9_9HYPH|nr:hypothetical protein [Aminobacter anthyllidis]MBT1154394.1 hypothetical protein [Aminobacter anthyllidis]
MIRTWRYTLWVMAGLALLIALFLMSRPAEAQQMCGPEPAVLQDLQKRFGEFVIMRGKTKDADVIVTHSENGQWSILIVRQMVACLVLGGKASEIDKGV